MARRDCVHDKHSTVQSFSLVLLPKARTTSYPSVQNPNSYCDGARSMLLYRMYHRAITPLPTFNGVLGDSKTYCLNTGASMLQPTDLLSTSRYHWVCYFILLYSDSIRCSAVPSHVVDSTMLLERYFYCCYKVRIRRGSLLLFVNKGQRRSHRSYTHCDVASSHRRHQR